MERRVVTTGNGLLRIEQRLRLPGVEVGTDVSGPACIYALVRVRQGTVAYRHDVSRLVAPRRFAVFIPPFGIVQASLERCDVISIATVFRPPPSADLPDEPLLLDGGASAPRSAAEAVARVRDATVVAGVGRSTRPAPLAARAKRILDRTYEAPLAIGQIAARLGAPHAVLSRTFRRDYGMAPVRYRHHVRVVDALIRFAEGAAPAEVFQDVGFDDLSRFYKVFRRVACAAPGSYRPSASKSAKT